MDIAIDHEAFRSRRLAVRTATFWRGARVLLDGAEAQGKRLKYELQDDAGRPRVVLLKPIFFDPIPRVQIDNEPLINLARPLFWYEWAWMALPMVLVVSGGGLGAMFGMLAVWTSTRIFRSERGTVIKYALSGLVSVVASVLFLICAVMFQNAIGKK